MLRIAAIIVLSALSFSFSIVAETAQGATRQLDEMGLYYSADALAASVKANDLRAVDLFMEAGMNPDVADPGEPPVLAYAAEEGNTLIIETLLGHGANPDAFDPTRDKTALFYAVESEHPEVIWLLLKYGANPNIAGPEGVTPLMLAAQQGDNAVVRLLLRAGADVDAQADNGWAAELFAKQAGHDDVILTLERWYAAVSPAPVVEPPRYRGRQIPLTILRR